MYNYKICLGMYEDKETWFLCHEEKMTLEQVKIRLSQVWAKMRADGLLDLGRELMPLPVHVCFKLAGFTHLQVEETLILQDAIRPEEFFEDDLKLH